jgi:hypothetical protein
MITILDKLISKFRNPTANWPQMGQQELIYDLRLMAINGYCLNSRLELAEQFGKCAYTKRLGKEFLDLFYPDSGLILQFASRELMAITAIVSRDSFHVRENKMGVGKISIIDISGRAHSLNESTTLRDLTTYLGKSVESDKVGDDMVHTFILKKNYIDTYHHPVTGQLFHVEIAEADETSQKDSETERTYSPL